MTTRYSIPIEMRMKTRAYHQYRFRRFQSLCDALEIYFSIPIDSWLTVFDILEVNEIPRLPTNLKRIRRILYALERIGRVEVQPGRGNRTLTLWRRI